MDSHRIVTQGLGPLTQRLLRVAMQCFGDVDGIKIGHV